MKDPRNHLLNAKGVTSEVKDGEVIGHVMLLDYDGGTSFNRLLSDCANLPGLTAVLESSPGSWHVYNTTVRSYEGTALQMLEHKCDPMHISVGYRRGRWTLRLFPKTHANAQGADDAEGEYKSAPEPLQFWCNHTIRPQSRPHLNLLSAVFRESDNLPNIQTDFTVAYHDRLPNTVGEEYRISAYRTITDEMKGELDNA